MAEALGVAASITAIVHISSSVIKLCNTYIKAVRDAPSDLQLIRIEVSALVDILNVLSSTIEKDSTVASHFDEEQVTMKGCRRAISEIEQLFPSATEPPPATKNKPSKSQRAHIMMTALAWPLKANKASRLLNEVIHFKTTIIAMIMVESAQDIKTIKANTIAIHDTLSASQRREMCRWLETTDPSPIHNRSQDLYEHGTGDWVSRLPEWMRLISGGSRCLWIQGIPGAGKTVLMSHLINRLRDHADHSSNPIIAIVYYYCYFGRAQDESGPFLRWLISQLCRQAEKVPLNGSQCFRRGGELTVSELFLFLESVLGLFETVYIVLDAIDESIRPRDNFLRVIRELATVPRYSNTRILASSRDHYDIEETMKSISDQIPMTNSCVEEDIKQYVHSRLKDHPKFRVWPKDLLDEVGETLSKKAEGMFRWAVCQIDVLSRLKCERGIIHNALQNLPKTLFETYDRILAEISQEDKAFVHHVLEWIAFHNQLHDGKEIPCEVLLQAATRSAGAVDRSVNDRSYSSDVLQDICGCLIHITGDRPCMGYSHFMSKCAVSFAHYTVREYLDAHRMQSRISPHLRPDKRDLWHDLMHMVLLEAQHPDLDKFQETSNSLVKRTGHSAANHDVMIEDFTTYCILSALTALKTWPPMLFKFKDLWNLIHSLLNPSGAFCGVLKDATWFGTEFYGALPGLGNGAKYYEFWNITWHSEPEISGGILLNIFILSDLSDVDYIALTHRFLEKTGVENVMRNLLDFSMLDPKDVFANDQWYRIRGSMIEVCTQLSFLSGEIMKLLLEFAVGMYDPSKALLTLTWRLCYASNSEAYLPGLLDCLLELGADPNVGGYRVSALQIAVACRSPEIVEILLREGANPNKTGDRGGTFWKQDSPMGHFNKYHGSSPLRILRRYCCVFQMQWISDKRREQMVESLLLQHGAQELVDE